MSGMTVGQFVEAIGAIADSLGSLASGLSNCNMDLEIDRTEGKKVVCQIPVVAGNECRFRTVKEPRIADLHEAVEALAAWAADIKSSLAEHGPNEPLFAPPPDPSVDINA